MATTLKDFKFNLAKVSTDGSGFDAANNEASVISSAGTDAYVAGTDNTIVMTGFGTIKGAGTGATGNVIFTGDANMQSGNYITPVHGSNGKIATFDASKASAKLSLTTDLVSVDGGVLKAGSGDDTIDVKANDAVTSSAISVTGGLGADLFKISSSDSSINVSDYNYAQGDRISVSALTNITQYGSGSNTMVLGSVSVDGYAADNVYKFGILEGANANKYDYVAAVSSANVSYTAGTDNLMFNADGSGNVVVDASKAANASITATVKDANITLGGNKDSKTSVVAGQDSSDSSVVVDLGYGKDTVSVAAGAALTLKVGREDNVNVLATNLDSDDTLVLSSGKLSDIVVSGSDFVFGATSVNGALSTAPGGFKVQFGSGEAKKLAYAGGGSAAVKYNKDVSYYMGVGNNSISVATGFTDDVLLNMIDNTSSINHVDVTKANAKAKVDIVATGKATINAAAAHKDVEWKFDLTANDIVAPNSLDVTGATGVDRIILSDSAKGNADKVTGFAAGEDILELSNVDKLTEKTFTRGAANTAVVLQNSKASIDGALANGTDLDVVLADGTAKKVALAGAGTGTAGAVVATQKTTTVINQDTVDGIVKFDIDEATENNAAFVVDMTGTVSNAIDYLGKFTSIDATVDAANALIVGNEAITNIKVTGSADHGAAVWAGAKANAAIEFSAGTDNTGNILWTGALDGASSVTGFDEKDKLYVYGVDGLSKTAVAESFGINDTDITYHTGASSMTFLSTPSGNIDVMYMDSTAKGGYGYKKVSFNTTASGNVAYNTDVDVYIGTANATVTVSNDAVAEGDLVAINLSNKGAGSVEEGGAYYKGIHNIDASASAGTFLLIGDNSNGAQLKGGAKGNAIWGGGDASQNMTGFAGVADIFWFGSKDGHDVVTNFGTKDGASGDAVFLYDATSIDAVQITAEGNAAKVVFRNTNSTLTLDKVSNIDDVKFMLNNADGGYDYYKYDSKTSAFVPQKA